MSKSKFVVGVLAGAVIGATAVLFNTPSSGETVRNGIKTSTNSTKSNINALKVNGAHVKQSVTVLTNELKNNIPVIINDLKNTFQQFQKEIEPNLSKLKENVTELNKSTTEIQKSIDDFNKKSEKTSI